jgi:hypothetical protein
MRAYVLASFLAVAATDAEAFCSVPSFYDSSPDAPGTFARPDVPYCLRELKWSGRHTCDDWEIDRYRSDVEAYVDKLNDYIREAVDFANAATRFAGDAGAYARCEADEVLTQHE